MTPSDWTSAATRPEMDAGLQYHIRCKRGDVERYVLLPGDPDRVDLIAAEWDESRRIANYREHRTFSGRLGTVGVTCCSTGAGGGSTSSALEELVVLGGDTFIRVGTTAALQREIECGDVIISTGAMRHDGTSQRSEEHTSELQSQSNLVCRLLLEKKKKQKTSTPQPH